MTESEPHLDADRDPLLTVPEIAKQLRLSEWTIREWIKDGELRGWRAGKRNYRVHRSELDRFLRESGRQPEPQGSTSLEDEALPRIRIEDPD